MLRSIFLLNGFSRAFIPPIDDEPDTCEIIENIAQVSTPETTSILAEVIIGSLVFIAFFCYIWFISKKKINKKRQRY